MARALASHRKHGKPEARSREHAHVTSPRPHSGIARTRPPDS